MNGALLHLLLSHLPVVGCLIAFVVLAANRHRDDASATRVGLVLALVSALAAVPTFLTGPPAVQLVRALGPDGDPYMVTHAKAALGGLLCLLVFGTVALAALRTTAKKPRLSATLTKVAIVLGFVSVMVSGYVAQTGYDIRHTEVRAGAAK